MSEAKIAIIMPAFNAARTLRLSAESVLAQTLRAIELWVVDDGSTDDTGCIADELACKDARVKVIHQLNQGAFRARVNALQQITTEYFGFVDADDTVSAVMYEKLISVAEANHLDVVQCEAFHGGESRGLDLYLDRESVMTQIVKPWLFEGRGAAYLWDKIYRRKCLDCEIDATYSSSVFEDLILNMYFFRNVTRFGMVHENLYHYTPNDGSTTRNFKEKHLKGFSETIALRNVLASEYGIGAGSRSMADWVVRNAANFVRLVGASRGSILESSANLKRIVNLPEIQSAMCLAGPSESRRLLRCAASYPRAMMLGYQLRHLARRCLRG